MNGKYLGIYLGPESSNIPWEAVAVKLLTRAGEIKLAARGLMARAYMFNIYANSLAIYKGQFALPSPGFIKIHRRAEQRITAAPWMAIPPVVLRNLDLFSLPITLKDPRVQARAFHVRMVAQSPVFWRVHAQVMKVFNSDDACLCPPLRQWHDESIIFTLERNWRAVPGISGARELMTSAGPPSGGALRATPPVHGAALRAVLSANPKPGPAGP